ncbi:hypothetical protein [Flaviaesturariibacter amylovorans]|uniref:Transcriptional regulator n=1 Tax=Flaviaesturariibacter amylovorans TaxID=1084520 RepID=A0ABP8HI19_9BACT
MESLFVQFFKAVREDPRIAPVHISLYTALYGLWAEKGFQNPVSVFSKEVMPLCKISGSATYHRSMRELHQYGYIQYVPSYNHFLGSLIYFIEVSGKEN